MASGSVEASPEAIASFLRQHNSSLDKEQLGEYLGHHDELEVLSSSAQHLPSALCWPVHFPFTCLFLFCAFALLLLFAPCISCPLTCRFQCLASCMCQSLHALFTPLSLQLPCICSLLSFAASLCAPCVLASPGLQLFFEYLLHCSVFSCVALGFCCAMHCCGDCVWIVW